MKPANTSAEEQALRAEAIVWVTKDRGPDRRVIHELVLGRRRIDLVFVYPFDIIGVEIKGPLDSLSDGRLDHQLTEFNYFLPEVWLAVDRRWAEHEHVRHYGNRIVMNEQGIFEQPRRYPGWKPQRDEMCCSRLLSILWRSELLALAGRHNLVQVQLGGKMKAEHLRKMLARMLTGHEIMTGVCTELRSRPLVGMASDKPLERRAGPLPSLFR